MPRLLGTILLAIAALVALPCAAIALFIAISTARIHREVERKIAFALSSHYPGEDVSVNDRIDFGYLTYGQICFDVTLRSPKTGSTRRNIVRIDGGDDGGAWTFGRVFETMRDCEDGFDRG